MDRKKYMFVKTKLILSISLGLSTSFSVADQGIDLLDIDSGVSFASESRAVQSKHKNPSSVTIIDAARIKDLGATSIAELMRLVPGMSVLQATGWDYRINMHGTNALTPRRMLILIDGMSFYRFGYNRIDWSFLPFSTADIERIEVTRSPSGAIYGSNAFQAVVNIITRHPKDKPSKEVSTVVGSNGLATGHLWANGNVTKNTTMSIGVSKKKDSGFDLVSYDQGKNPVPGAVDSHEISRVLMRSETLLDSGSVIELHAGGETATMDDVEVDPNQLAYPKQDQSDHYLQAKWVANSGKHNFTTDVNYQRTNFNQNWSACNATAAFVPELRELALKNSSAAWDLLYNRTPKPRNEEEKQLVIKAVTKFKQLGSAALKRPICGWGNQDVDERRTAGEFMDFYQGENFNVTTGVGLQNVEYDSETFTNGVKSTDYFYFFQNAEYSPIKWMTVNGGFIYEKIRTVEDEAFSPKLGFNFHVSESDSLRIVYSESKRMPSINETSSDCNYIVRGWDHEFNGQTEGRFFLQTRAPKGLEPEKIESTELGWVGSAFDGTLNYDTRFFYDQMRDLISEKGRYFDYGLTNNSSNKITGVEEELKYKLSAETMIHIGYSYMDAEATNPYELGMYARHIGFAQLTHHFNDVTATIAHYSNSQMSGESFDKSEFTVHGPLFKSKGLGVEWTGTIGKVWSDEIAYKWVLDNRALNSYSEQAQYKLGVSAKF